MTILKFSDFLLEKITIEEITSKYVGRDKKLRGQVLVDILRTDSNILPKLPISETENIEIVNADEILKQISKHGIFDPEKAKNFFKPSKRYTKVFQDSNLNWYSLSDIYKSPELGGGKGTSAGSKNTRLMESIQAIFLNYRLKIGSEMKEEDIMDLITYLDLEDPDVFIPEYIDKEKILNLGLGWLRNIIRSANAIVDGIKEYSNLGTKYNIYQGYYQLKSKDDIISEIKKSFSQALKNSKYYQHINFAKWNPSDIWLIDPNIEWNLRKKLEPFQKNSQKYNIDKFNELMDTYFTKGQVIGISLKMTNLKDHPRIRINKMMPTINYQYEGFEITENPFSTINTNIRYKNERDENYRSIVFRSFQGDSPSNIQGEVLGLSARHGKVNLNYINSIFNLHDMNQVSERDELSIYNEEELKNLIFELQNKLVKHFDKSDDNDRLSPYKPDRNPLTRAALISKYQALQIVNIFIKADRETTNQALTDILHYAISHKMKFFIKKGKNIEISETTNPIYLIIN